MSEQQRLKYADLSPEAIGAMRGVEHYLNVGSGLSPVLLELVRLRASQMNGCEFCIGMHSHELAKHHEPESRVAAVAGWRESEAFTETERAALAWTEAVTNVQDGHVPDAALGAVREHFPDKEVVDLTVAIASIGAWNRIGVAFRPQWRGAKVRAAAATADVDEIPVNRSLSEDGERAVVGDDGGKVSVDEG